MTSPTPVIVLLTILNLLNFIDRGIIPGSTVEFNHFIKNTTHTKTPDTFLGLLQSSFIVGFIIGSIIFGHMVHYFDKFVLIQIGMFVWMVAILCSGLSAEANSYEFLIIARMFSGFGEASLQCTAPPWIQEHASPSQRGMWLSIFYTSIPVGTAIGFAYSSALSSTVGWKWAFFGEVIMMLPIFVLLLQLSETQFHPKQLHGQEEAVEETGEDNDKEDTNKSIFLTKTRKSKQPPTLWNEIQSICQYPIYVCLILASAAQTASLNALCTFGSAFVMGIGYFQQESDASTTFGALVSIAGIVGTPLGGWLVDRLTRHIQTPTPTTTPIQDTPLTTYTTNELHQGRILAPMNDYQATPHTEVADSDEASSKTRSSKTTNTSIPIHVYQQLHIILQCLYWCNFIGTFLLCIVYFISPKILYFFIITLGCLFVFATNTGLYMGFMIAVPETNQSFAVAFGAIICHVLGDVPSPVIAGWLKDDLAPDCVTSADDDSASSNVLTSDACRDQGDQLRLCFLLISLWMIWATVLFAIGWHWSSLKIRAGS